MFPPFALSISNPILCLNQQQSEELVEGNISNYSTWVISYQHINMLRVQTVQVINLKKTHPRQSHPSSHSHLHIVGSRQNLSSVTQISHMMRTMVMIVMSHITSSKFPPAFFIRWELVFMIGVEVWLLLIFQAINFYFSWTRYKGCPSLLILQFFNIQKKGGGSNLS